ncbi:hypothetical protein MMC31_004102, partial [Peltigera leucophlebia]|nr:hypothetical protein [Peltigera leucophlebia]
MAFLSLLGQIITFASINIFEQALNAADWIMFNIEYYEVFENIVKFLSYCVGNFYFWQTVAVIGFCHYLRRLAAKFPSPIIPVDVGPIEVGPGLEQVLAEKENSLKEAAGKNEDLNKEVAGLRAKVNRLEKEVDFISKDRYALVREKCTLQNKLGDFNSWPEFRVEFDELATQYEAMKRQRAREHISHEQILHVAKEARFESAAAKRAEAMSKVAHSEELKVVKQERDEAKVKHQTLLNTIAEGNTPGEIALREENTRLTLALRSENSLLAKITSECERLQSLIKTRSENSTSKLKSAASIILVLKEDLKDADERIAELEEAVKEANDKAEQMEDMYMA